MVLLPTHRPRRPALATSAALLLSSFVLGGCAAQDSEQEPSATSAATDCVLTAADLLPEPGRALLGVNLDWATETLDEFGAAAGWRPATAVVFTELPLTDDNRTQLLAAADQVRAQNSSLLLTLEPHAGLDAVTDAVMRETAELLAQVSGSGVPVVVRFAHEMNGSWYSWSQQPKQYVAKFRTMAAELDATAPGVAMMWAPNYGGGYPFSGGKFETKAGDRGFGLLDTDGDGTLTMADDPYAPYYPGDDVVDWVGMSLYHWGSAYPWGEDEVAEPTKFVDQLHGRYDGLGGDDAALPDFAKTYSRESGIPLAIPETAAFVTAGADPDLALRIKKSWWEQVFAPETLEQVPGLAMVNWFEWDKFESEVDGQVDWTVGRDAKVAKSFRAALPDWVQLAPDTPRC